MPTHDGQGPRDVASGACLGTGRCAVHHPAGDALGDGRQAEQVVGQVEIPISLQGICTAAASALTVAGHVVKLARDAEGRQVQPGDAAEHAGLDVPAHAVVAEVGQGVADGRQLPIQHRHQPGLGGVEDQVVEPVVAMHDAGLAAVAGTGGQVAWQPGHQAVHLGDGLGDRGRVLLAPAADLTLEIVAGTAKIGQTDRTNVHVVQACQHPVHLVVEGPSFCRRQARQRLLPEHPALDKVHQVEGAADH